MKTILQVSLVALATCLWMSEDVTARGPRGGGGGRGGVSRGGGGMSRPSPSFSRSPSVSRPSPSRNRPSTPSVSRPSAPSAKRPSTPSVSRPPAPSARRPSTPSAGRPSTGRPSVGAQPSRGDLQNFLNIPGPSAGGSGRPSNLPSRGGSNLGAAVAGGAAGGAAAEFLQNRGSGGPPQASQLPAAATGDRVGQRPGAGEGPVAGKLPAERPAAGDRVANRGDRVDNRIDNRAGRIEDRTEWRGNRTTRRNEIRDQVRRNHPRLDFWSRYPGWARWRINRPYRWATWAALTGWFSFGWGQPSYYYYGENVYYQGDIVYYGDNAVCSAEEYAQQAEQIVSSAPETAPEQSEWMPLGVFALTQDGQASGPDPSLFLQLVVNKEGAISGTFNNSATDTTQTIEGMVDKKSQRAAWTVAGKTRPLMETGICSLTEDTAAALVHFEDGQTQQWLMVRLEDPENAGAN